MLGAGPGRGVPRRRAASPARAFEAGVAGRRRDRPAVAADQLSPSARIGVFAALRTATARRCRGCFPLFFVFLFLSLDGAAARADRAATGSAPSPPEPRLLHGRGACAASLIDGLGRRGAGARASGAPLAICVVVPRRCRVVDAADEAGADMRWRRVTSVALGRRVAATCTTSSPTPRCSSAAARSSRSSSSWRSRAASRRSSNTPGFDYPRLHGVPVRLRAAAGVGVRRRVHRLHDRRATSSTASRGG